MGMNEYLPTICDEVIYEDKYHKITKIAVFNKKCYVHTFGNEWHVRPDWEVEYTLTEFGRKIKLYERVKEEGSVSDIKENCEIEENLNEKYEIVYPYGNFYCCSKTIDGATFSSLVDRNGKIIVEGQFLFPILDGNILCEDRNRITFVVDGQCGIMDFEGNVKVAPKYGNVSGIYDQLIVMADKDGYYLITDQGDIVWKNESLLSMYDDLVTIWDEKPQILRYECKNGK